MTILRNDFSLSFGGEKDLGVLGWVIGFTDKWLNYAFYDIKNYFSLQVLIYIRSFMYPW